MSLETEYRGYKVRYNENSDEWTCLEAGTGMAAPTLSAVKEKIDRLCLSIRKSSAVRCWELQFSNPNITEVSVIEYLGPKVERPWGGKNYISAQRVAAVGVRNSNANATRAEKSLSDLMPDTPKALAALKQADLAYRAFREAEETYKAAHAAIPRLGIEDIKDLVRISGIDPTGGLGGEGA